MLAVLLGWQRWSQNSPTAPRQPATEAATAETAAPQFEPATIASQGEGISTPAPAPSESASEADTASQSDAIPDDAIREALSAVVSVETDQGKGSGFFVGTGLVLTSEYLVAENTSVSVQLASGRSLTARVERVNRDLDLALARVDPPEPKPGVLRLGTASELHVGQEVVAVTAGSGERSAAVRHGRVTSLRPQRQPTLVYTDVPPDSVGRGGPILDLRGLVVAIQAFGATDTGFAAFGVAADQARTLTETGGTPPIPSPAPPYPAEPSTAPVVNPPGPSTTDSLRERGAAEFESAVAALALKADRLDLLWERWQGHCLTRSGDGGVEGRAWFGIWSTRLSMRDPGLPECQIWLAEVTRQADEIRAGMDRAEEDARRAGLQPGVRRQARGKHRLDWESWRR